MLITVKKADNVFNDIVTMWLWINELRYPSTGGIEPGLVNAFESTRVVKSKKEARQLQHGRQEV